MATRRKKFLGTIALIVLAISLIAIYRQLHRPEPPSPKKEWFYDLNTRRLFSGPVGELPPIAAPSGPLPDGSPAGARAYVFTCTDCSERARFIAYLELYSEQARVARQVVTHPYAAGAIPNQPGHGILVKRPEDKDWVERNSQQGQQIIGEMSQRCGSGKFARSCSPTD